MRVFCQFVLCVCVLWCILGYKSVNPIKQSISFVLHVAHMFSISCHKQASVGRHFRCNLSSHKYFRSAGCWTCSPPGGMELMELPQIHPPATVSEAENDLPKWSGDLDKWNWKASFWIIKAVLQCTGGKKNLMSLFGEEGGLFHSVWSPEADSFSRQRKDRDTQDKDTTERRPKADIEGRRG